MKKQHIFLLSFILLVFCLSSCCPVGWELIPSGGESTTLQGSYSQVYSRSQIYSLAHVKGHVQRSVISSAVSFCVHCPIISVAPLCWDEAAAAPASQQWDNQSIFDIFHPTKRIVCSFYLRRTQSPAPSCTATRSPTLHLSGTPGAFPASLQSHPRDAAAATASCHVATISNAVEAPSNATKPCNVAQTISFTHLIAREHADHLGFHLVAGVFCPRRRQR